MKNSTKSCQAAAPKPPTTEDAPPGHHHHNEHSPPSIPYIKLESFPDAATFYIGESFRNAERQAKLNDWLKEQGVAISVKNAVLCPSGLTEMEIVCGDEINLLKIEYPSMLVKITETELWLIGKDMKIGKIMLKHGNEKCLSCLSRGNCGINTPFG